MPVEHIQFVAREVLSRADFLIPQWLPDGKRTGHEWIARNPTRRDVHLGSFRINLNTGAWCDFATDDKGGDLVSLYAYLEGVKQGEAAGQLAQMLGLNDKPHAIRPSAESKTMWEPLTPIPANAPLPPQAHPKHGKSSCSWTYRNERGVVLCYVLRFDLPEGKEILPLTYCRNEKGETAWRWRGLPEPRPLYHLNKLVANSQATVIICEGEKAADACSELFPDCVSTTTLNGAQSPHKTDFTPLAARVIWLWPDTDEPGRRYAEAVAELASKAGAREVKILHVPGDHPSGWDAANALAEGWQTSRGFQLLDIEPTAAKESEEAAQETDAEAITRLAALSLLEYSRARKDEAKKLGVTRVTDLDAEVRRAQEEAKVDLGAALPSGKGQGLNVHEADPWPSQIDLNEVLNQLITEINRYAVLPVHADTTIALWIAHTYVYDAGDISPFLFLTSPEKRCGKSTVLILLLGLVNRPMVASNISPSSIFRVIEACRPTLLIDEADTFFNENEELRGVMNSGHTKALAYVIRTVDIGGGVFEPRQFSTWAPKAVAGIKRLADTLEDRSIIIELKRKLPGEHTERVAKFNGDTIRQKLTRWARDNFEAIKCADPQLPTGVHNRLADNWLPLLAIAELAGTEWTDRATRALLSGMDNDSRTESAGVMLLSDLRALFNERPDPAYLATQDILDYLHAMDDRPWSAFGKFPKPITSEAMARLLKPFKIKPGQINEINARGYYLNDLKDAFDRYIPIRGGVNLHTCINPEETRGTEDSNLHKANQRNAGSDPPEGALDKEECKYASWKGGNTENASNSENRDEIVKGSEGGMGNGSDREIFDI